MASNNIGKTFEQEFKECVPPDYYLYRLKDDTSGFYGVSNPCDYILFRSPYHITVQDVIQFTQTEERKSIPVEWCRDHGVKIEQKKKRVRYSYDLESWLSRYFGGVK